MATQNWESAIRKVVPYVPGEQPQTADIIKLNTNENPYPPAPGVTELLRTFDSSKMKLYPDTESKVLVDELAKFYNLKNSQIITGVGSDDILALIFLTCFNTGRPILCPDITYSFYDVWAKLYNVPFERPLLNEDFTINPDDYIGKNAGGIIFPNPNAPTGVFESVEMIEKIIRENQDIIVVIDEAYIDFGGTSCLSLLEKYENLLVVQTFSKSRSMAGVRIGCVFGNEKLISYLNDVRFSINSYTMNTLSQICGAEAVRDKEYFVSTLEKIVATRERTKKELTALGFTDSKTNFIFAKHEKLSGDFIFNELKKRKIFVRHWNLPRIEDYLRITIGTDEQMNKVVEALKEIIG